MMTEHCSISNVSLKSIDSAITTFSSLPDYTTLQFISEVPSILVYDCGINIIDSNR